MPSAEVEMDRREDGASVEARSEEAVHPTTVFGRGDEELAKHVEKDANDHSIAGQHVDKVAPSSPSEASTPAGDLKRKREADDPLESHEPTKDDASDSVRQFSLAQVRVQVKRARLEANIAVQEDVKALRFALLRAEQTAQEHAREKQQVEERYELLQKGMDDIVKMHQRTLHGMRDNLKLEQLLASLDKEKASKEALRESFQQQNAELLRAQQRIASLESQITKYQKTETVLAQSIGHFERQFANRDHERSATIDRVKQELELQHAETRLALEADVKHLVLERDELQLQLQKLQADHIGLQETAHAVVEMQETREAEQLELRARVAQLETEKAVLQSKVDQVQKADAQLRGKIQTLDELVLQLQQEKQVLQNENTELGKIATDLMDMAEQQHAQKQEILKTPDKDGDERLARTRTRLRQSLG